MVLLLDGQNKLLWSKGAPAAGIKPHLRDRRRIRRSTAS
jgi:hypothetical protein